MKLQGLLNNNKLLEKKKAKKEKQKKIAQKWHKDNPKAVSAHRKKGYAKQKRSRADSCGGFSNGSSSIGCPIDDLFSKDVD